MPYTPADVGEHILAVSAVAAGAGTTAGTAVNGYVIDRFALATNGNRYASVQIAVPYNFVKATATTVAMNAHLQDSAVSASTSASWADYGSTVASEGSGNSTVGTSTAAVTSNRTFRRNVNILGARRYVRVRITPHITVVSTANSLNYNAVLVFGGGENEAAV